MVRRLSLLVLLVSSCVFLASLYLLWVESTPTAAHTSIPSELPFAEEIWRVDRLPGES